MTPCRFDFYLPTNGDYVEEIPFTEKGVPVDLTNLTFHSEVRSTYDGPTVYLTLNDVSSKSQEGIHRIEPAAGIIQVRINRESIDAMYDAVVPSTYTGRTVQIPYDTLVTLPNGDIEQWFGGYMILNKGVTQ
jgi:hypothetical protein